MSWSTLRGAFEARRKLRQWETPPLETSNPGWGPAAMSEDGRHRYTLARALPVQMLHPNRVLFVMLNPSTADDNIEDPTIRRCIDFAMRHGADAMAVANLFSLRSTDPRALKTTPDAEGDPHNLTWILEMALSATLVICAWGTHGALRGRDATVTKMLLDEGVRLHALKVTKDGHPAHPLYLPKTARAVPWVPGEKPGIEALRPEEAWEFADGGPKRADLAALARELDEP